MESNAHRRTVAILAGVLGVQAAHFVEHIIQLIQVYALRIPETRALGALGAVFAFHGTEEWMHLAFNVSLLTALLWFQPFVRHQLGAWSRPYRAYLFLGVGVEMWHVIEHLVVTGNMLANGGGCPCPGILDRVVPETILHLGYNAAALTGLAIGTIPILIAAVRRRPFAGRLET
jgi:hypothetical protein